MTFCNIMRGVTILTLLLVLTAVPARAQTDARSFDGTAREFMTICRPVTEACEVNFELVVNRTDLEGSGCVPLELDYGDIFNAVMIWLDRNPDLHHRDWEEGVGAALRALWPCPGN